MPAIEIDYFDLEQALSQIATLREALAEEQSELDVLLQAAVPDEIEIAVSERQVQNQEQAIREIQEEGRRYYYALNDVPVPELCGLCNFNPINKNVVFKECPSCGGPFKNNRAHPDQNWLCAKFSLLTQSVIYFTENSDGSPDIAGVEGI